MDGNESDLSFLFESFVHFEKSARSCEMNYQICIITSLLHIIGNMKSVQFTILFIDIF